MTIAACVLLCSKLGFNQDNDMTMRALVRMFGAVSLTTATIAIGCDGETTEGDCAEGEVVNEDPEDCIRTACRDGQLVTEPANNEVPDDGLSCTVDTCDDGKKNNVVQVDGPCKKGNTEEMGICDNVGRCVDCTEGTPCQTGFSCFMGQCWSCSDGVLNGSESDIDCGQGCMIGCAIGERCRSPLDCMPGADCDNDECVSCTDGILNGNESDIDCGGQCNDCADGKICDDGNDCESRVCAGTCQAPTCTDGEQNGDETDNDCGGSCMTKCPEGDNCVMASDCVMGLVCTGNVCQMP
jgi:hypothetical protein